MIEGQFAKPLWMLCQVHGDVPKTLLWGRQICGPEEC